MTNNTRGAIWISHSKIADFLKCPRSFYLRHIYKDPKTRHKITVTSPALSLGMTVHEVIESLSALPVGDRLDSDPLKKLDLAWEKVTGKMGGFISEKEEKQYKERAISMIQNVIDHPGPIVEKAIKLKTDPNLTGLSWYFFSEEEGIILSGKVDWIEYLEDSDAIHIIDFKTGKNDESEDSLQLPVYYLLAKNLQSREIKKMSYWYLDRDSKPTEVELPNPKDAEDKIMDVAKRIKLATQIDHFKCPNGKDGCFSCRQLEKVINGEGELIGSNGWQDIYVLPTKKEPKLQPSQEVSPTDIPY